MGKNQLTGPIPNELAKVLELGWCSRMTGKYDLGCKALIEISSLERFPSTGHSPSPRDPPASRESIPAYHRAMADGTQERLNSEFSRMTLL